MEDRALEQTNPVPHLGNRCLRVGACTAVGLKPHPFIELPRLSVLFQNPQCHVGEIAPAKLRKHLVEQQTPVSSAAQMRQ